MELTEKVSTIFRCEPGPHFRRELIVSVELTGMGEGMEITGPEWGWCKELDCTERGRPYQTSPVVYVRGIMWSFSF